MTNDSLPQKKGRPTPKRRDVESARKTFTLAPAHSKEQKARQKAAARAARVAQRAAYLRGDENALPLRDRGPVKRFVRNYVDSRRSIGEFFLPIIGVVLFISLISDVLSNALSAVIGVVIMYTVLFASIIDGILLSRKIKREVAARFPSESLKGIGMYGWLRSTQMRRMRAPKPGVSAGDKV